MFHLLLTVVGPRMGPFQRLLGLHKDMTEANVGTHGSNKPLYRGDTRFSKSSTVVKKLAEI